MILAEIRPYPVDLPRDGESRKWHLQLATLEILEAWHHDLAARGLIGGGRYWGARKLVEVRWGEQGFEVWLPDALAWALGMGSPFRETEEVG